MRQKPQENNRRKRGRECEEEGGYPPNSPYSRKKLGRLPTLFLGDPTKSISEIVKSERKIFSCEFKELLS
jgi:hypothetical protein